MRLRAAVAHTLSALLLALIAAPSGAAQDRPAAADAVFVLVHGAFAGGWVWQDVADRLRAAGHDVYTPTLSGLGERAHLGSPDLGLDTHVRDVVAVMEYEDLDDVVLVAHSYGGFVAVGAASAAPSRVARVVFLDAFVPESGESVADLYDPAVVGALQEQAAQGDGWQLPPLPPVTDQRFTSHPVRTLLEPLDLAEGAWGSAAWTYVDFTAEEEGVHRGPLDLSVGRAQERGWPVYEIDAGHMGMWTHPAAVADVLRSVAENQANADELSE